MDIFYNIYVMWWNEYFFDFMSRNLTNSIGHFKQLNWQLLLPNFNKISSDVVCACARVITSFSKKPQFNCIFSYLYFCVSLLILIPAILHTHTHTYIRTFTPKQKVLIFEIACKMVLNDIAQIFFLNICVFAVNGAIRS